MTTSLSQLRLPRITKVRLHRFSLFAANPDAEFEARDGVLCLVGANGIGKSTLLSAINYCLTGTVPDPNRAFESMEEYYKFTRSYSASYFRGRISGSDEKEAEITVCFKVGAVEYEVRRGMFEPEELRGLRITDRTDSKPVDRSPAENVPRGERHDFYAESLVTHTGSASFQEFVFLQHFVFTFDEQRRTLFWNPRIMERVLFRAFGVDPGMAKQADSMRREIDHEDSKVRNYQWEATRMRRRINQIRAQSQEAVGAQEKYDRLTADHETLSNLFEAQSKELKDAEDALKDASLRLGELSIRDSALREEYSRFFNRRFGARPPLEGHPLIAKSLSDHRCGLCGKSGDKVHGAIVAKVNKKTCPLCDTETKAKDQDPADLERLKEIDKELARLRKTLIDVQLGLESLKAAEQKARDQWNVTRSTLEEFERANTSTLESLLQLLGKTPGLKSLDDYRDQLALLEKEKKAAYDHREKVKKQLLQLKRELQKQYVEVEKTFVPKFSDLAYHFLGMPLTVQFEAEEAQEVKLVVSVRGTTRRQQQHLSESQRFFLDIALRMALTQHMSKAESAGGMFIDTPEGSLDIAYEKRAGEMLAKFATSGHQVVMTANLNSSKLLLALARSCGPQYLTLCRMTEWAELSEVQQEEESLFDEAYAELERALNG